MSSETASRLAARAYIGWFFRLTNRADAFELSGSMHELLQALHVRGLDGGALNNRDSKVSVSQCKANGASAVKFKDGPHTRNVMAIIDAVRDGRLDEAESLIKADSLAISGTHDAAVAPIQIHASVGNADVVRFLISHGSVVNARGQFGMTPLHWAAAFGYGDVCDVLLEAGADCAIESWFLVTPGQLAHANRHVSAVGRFEGRDGGPLDGWKLERLLKRVGAM